LNILDLILNSGAVGQIARRLGLPETAVRLAITALLPALTRGLQRNAARPGGLESLLGALGSGNHDRYIDQPAELGNQASIEDGNAILGHILGSKDVSRNVAGSAAQRTGLDSALLKQMLPMLADAAMGALSKQTAAGSQLRAPASPAAGSDPFAMLSGLLDADREGDASDELLDLARRFF
jgi:hypothetical protein